MGRKPGRTPEQAARHAKFVEWKQMPKELRQPKTLTEMCAQLGISNVTGIEWGHELEDIGVYTSDDHKEFLDKAKSIGFRGNSKALEIYGKAKGFLGKETEEEKVELTADEYYSILREARERVSQEVQQPDRDSGVSGELPVLPLQVRSDTDEGETSTDGEVGEVELPDRPVEPVSDGEQPDNSQGEAAGDFVAGSGIRPVAGSVQ